MISKITRKITIQKDKWMIDVLIDENGYVFFKLRDPYMREYWIPPVESEERVKLPKKIKKIIYGN